MYHFLINPAAGGGNALLTWKKIQPTLQQRQVNYTLHLSTSKADLIQNIRSLDLTKTKRLVILGGDGTLYLALNALHFPTKLDFTLAYIPCGSGNDFAKAAGIAPDPEIALDLILNTTSETLIDLGVYELKKIKTKGVFSNNLGIGFDARIVSLARDSWAKKFLNKIHLGKLVYASYFFKALYQQKPFNLKLKTADRKTIEFNEAFLCTLTNQPYFGGGACLWGDAFLTSGNLDLVVIEKTNLLNFILTFLQMILKKPLTKNGVHHYELSNGELEFFSPQFIQINGENDHLEPQVISFELTKQSFIMTSSSPLS